jgi:hypothetical protein
MVNQNALRLLTAIQAVAPLVTDISVSWGISSSVQVRPASQQAVAQPTIDAFDWSDVAQAAWQNLQNRTTAKATVDTGIDADAKALRAIVAMLLDEVNDLRAWIVSFKVETAAATNLANFQTRVATLPGMPARTVAQAKTAILNKIDGGTVD